MRFLILFCLGVAAWDFPNAMATQPKRKPEPGYVCKVEKRGDFGLVQSEFQVLDSGETHFGYIKWDAGDGQFKNPWITAAFFRQKDGHYSLGHGYISIMRHIWGKSRARNREH